MEITIPDDRRAFSPSLNRTIVIHSTQELNDILSPGFLLRIRNPIDGSVKTGHQMSFLIAAGGPCANGHLSCTLIFPPGVQGVDFCRRWS